jgi:hypothetical protein
VTRPSSNKEIIKQINNIEKLQFIYYFLQGVIEVGGFSEVWSVNDKWGRIEFFE